MHLFCFFQCSVNMVFIEPALFCRKYPYCWCLLIVMFLFAIWMVSTVSDLSIDIKIRAESMSYAWIWSVYICSFNIYRLQICTVLLKKEKKRRENKTCKLPIKMLQMPNPLPKCVHFIYETEWMISSNVKLQYYNNPQGGSKELPFFKLNLWLNMLFVQLRKRCGHAIYVSIITIIIIFM